MKSISIILALGGVAHADHTPADCEPAVVKLWPVFQELAQAQNHKLTDADRAALLAQCKQDVAKNPREPTLTCVLGAKDTAAVRACVSDAAKAVGERAKKTEAPLQLNRLAKDAKMFFISNAMYPKGKAARLPEKPCCPQTGHTCAVTTAWAKDPVWSQLEFSVDDANLFQYTYESSDGLTFHATATGDVSCSGKTVTYAMDGKVVNGNPITTLTEPK